MADFHKPFRENM